MVSTRPSPAPAKGRIAYPSAANYTPGDADQSPSLVPGETSRRDINNSDQDNVQGLKTWWKTFRERTEPRAANNRQVFGVPLAESIAYASVQISTAGDDGSLYVWGVIPVVVAKCGLYLKENGTEVEGAFRISGSTKRMRELQAIFDTGPKYGKNIDWKALTYTTHDVATIFRRFLTQMPEPIIPFDSYEEFRESYDEDGPVEENVARYKELIRTLPPINQYLLLYVLDLLHVFANSSDKNLMTAANLALIFQPGVLSHPVHVLRPKDHVLSQQVLEFLIVNQDHFLIGMQLPHKKKRKSPSKKAKSPQPPSSPPKPALKVQKADDDLMLPSDSDDEAPEGGYYVVESPGPRVMPTRTETSGSRSKLVPQESKQSTSAPTSQAPRANRQVVEVMDPSDSDDDAPPGGYEVRTGDPDKGRSAYLGRTINAQGGRARGASLATPAAPRSSDLSRRKTMPSRRLNSRISSATKEAP